eukprot:363579-Chlamydomonas_euryale.AAC.2
MIQTQGRRDPPTTAFPLLTPASCARKQASSMRKSSGPTHVACSPFLPPPTHLSPASCARRLASSMRRYGHPWWSSGPPLERMTVTQLCAL